jgi:peptide/nickel transport system permease protein
VFALQRMLPGDPLMVMAGEERDPAILAELRKLYRMDDPLPLQFLVWLGEVIKGNFGHSLRTNEPVTKLIAQTLPVTIQLAIASILVALAIGIPAGILSAVRKGTVIDYTANVVALSGLSIPNFWLGIVLILLISVQFRLLPASGYVPFFEDPLGALKTLAMPAFVLGNSLAATLMRHTRSAMLEVLRSDYIRNALVPIVTLSTLLFGELLAGAVLTEQVFTIPGFGKLIVDAVFNRDYGVVQGVVLCTAIGFIVMNLVADVLYILINPRLRTA